MAQIIQRHPALQFILKTLLIYLYGYYGAGQEPFIYNEF